MKKFLKFTSVLGMAVLTLGLTACNSDDNGTMDPTDPETGTTVVDLAMATPDLSSLVSALERAELVTALQADGNFTVLAPTNAAFDSFLSDNGLESLEDVPQAVLAQVLLNHVIVSDVPIRAADLASVGSGYTSTSANGPDEESRISIHFDTSDGVVFNGGATVTAPDAEASNGIVHIVDAVIDLPTVVTFITVDANFSTLENALTELTPETDYVDLLNRTDDETSVPFTIFAPVDTAFEKLATLPEEEGELAAILSNHVITGDNVRIEEITPGPSSATLEGDNLVFLVTGNATVSITDGSGNQDINLIRPSNIQATNGVIHSLDTVLMPDTDN